MMGIDKRRRQQSVWDTPSQPRLVGGPIQCLPLMLRTLARAMARCHPGPARGPGLSRARTSLPPLIFVAVLLARRVFVVDLTAPRTAPALLPCGSHAPRLIVGQLKSLLSCSGRRGAFRLVQAEGSAPRSPRLSPCGHAVVWRQV